MSSQSDPIVRALRRLIARDPSDPLRLDYAAIARFAESRLQAAGRMLAAPFQELLTTRTAPVAPVAPVSAPVAPVSAPVAPVSALVEPRPRSSAAIGRLARHRRPISLAACLLIVAVAAVSTQPTVSAAGDPSLPGSSAAPSDQGQYAVAAFYQLDGTIYNTIQVGDQAAVGGGFQWYTVVSGDTVMKIAGRFNLSVNTLYWANKRRLPDPESIQIGLRLLIPPVDGVVWVVGAGDTLSALAQKYKISTQAIVVANALPDENVTAGQILVVPVDPPSMPTAKPGCVGNCSYTGGTLRKPVAGYYTISQYYSSSHPAIDFSAASGTPVVASAGGTVVYAGWKTSGAGSGGGIVVWINHNGKLWTTYNHLSAEFVKAGQTVAAGQRIGSVGSTGNSTGPHLHFEVWVCYPWTGGNTSCTRNPLKYF